MTAGDDPMTYETYARDILFNGLWMNGGRPLGQGEPFYYQAFYPYFLAAAHWVFGEGMFGVLMLQRWLVALAAVLLTRIAMRLRGDAVWPIALAVSALFVWWKLAPISRDLLNESLYVPLLAAWAASLVYIGRRPEPARAAVAGMLGGFAAITRSTAMLSWFLVWPALVKDLAAHKRRATTDTIEVIEYAIAAPGPFAANMDHKALFALGFYDLYAPGWGMSPVYIAVWLSAIAGLLIVWRYADADRIAVILPLLIALTQYVAVVIVYPKGERLILPVHTMLLPYSAVAAYALWARATRFSR